MGNQRRKEERAGRSRPFPEERSVSAAVTADNRAQVLQRVRRHRLKKKIENERAAEIRATNGDNDVDGTLSRRAIFTKVNRIIEVLESELISCPGPHSRSELFNALWSHPSVKLNLPDFYLPPREAKAQMEVIENLTSELDAVKGVQSKEKLVVRGALLSAAVSSEVSNVRAIARVLRTSTSNVKNAHTRRRSLEESGTSVWAAPQRRQRSDVLSEETVEAVRAWWTSETRVSPNKKEVVRKRVPSSTTVEEHATHYLLESQVKALLTSLRLYFQCCI